MPRFIAEFGGLYCEWSTVVDAPLTELMSEPELREYLALEYGIDGLKDLAARMQRVATHGCSSRVYTKQDLLNCNRAGPQEAHVSSESELVRLYTENPDTSETCESHSASLAYAFRQALALSANPVLQALYHLFSRVDTDSLNVLLRHANEDGHLALVPGDTAFENFKARMTFLGDAGLSAHDLLVIDRLCLAGDDDLRFIFSNELYPLFSEESAQ